MDQLDEALDRFREAHFYIHVMEGAYHRADEFRWALNAFLRALKEVPQLLQMKLQNRTGFKDWFVPERQRLASDPLIEALSKRRDEVVHRGMLRLASKVRLGALQGSRFKVEIGLDEPLADSDEAMKRYLAAAKEGVDFLGLLVDDEDQVPCIYREWRIPSLDGELLNLASEAWLRVGAVVLASIEWTGDTAPPLSMDCRHSERRVKFRCYDRSQLREWQHSMERR